MHLSVVVRVVGLSAIVGLMVWLVMSGSPNRWTDGDFVRQYVRPLSAEERAQLLAEVEAVAKCAGVKAPVNLNAPWKTGALNLYVISSAGRGESGIRAGDARYFPSQNLFLVDEGIVWPSASEFPFAGLKVSESGSRLGSAKLWFQFALLHEIGHLILRHNVRAHIAADAAQIEDEADQFAFKKIVQLINERQQELLDEEGLFSYRRIKELPEPDRTISTIAALIQSFSVNLLFSEAAFSSYHSDNAHKAFVARFKPLLGRMLGESMTRGGKTFLLLALASMERVAAAGENITNELRSELPIQDLRLTDTDLMVLLSLKDGATKRVEIPLEGILRAPGAYWLPASTPPSAPDGSGQSLDLWASGRNPAPPKDSISDKALIQELSKSYLLGDIEQQCRVTRGVAATNPRDVLFTCPKDYYSAQYDQQSGQLTEVTYILGPQRHEGDVVQLVDARINDRRQTYLFLDSLSDGPHTHRHAIAVFSSRKYLPAFVAQIDLVTDWIPSGTTISDWFRISHPPTLYCDPIAPDIVCVDYLDSIFRFSPESSRFSVLFYPAGAQMRVNSRSVYAFYAPGSRRAFLAK